LTTGRNLHSHHFSSPLSSSQEVSAFGEQGWIQSIYGVVEFVIFIQFTGLLNLSFWFNSYVMCIHITHLTWPSTVTIQKMDYPIFEW
jgi:hypothetical protein